MRLSLTQATALVFACAGVLSGVGAFVAADAVEKRSEFEVQRAMTLEGFDWAEVTPDGLQIHLAGIAPSESARFRALTLAGEIIDTNRVIDEMGVTPSQRIDAPQFSIELLRTPSGLSAIGLIPTNQNRADLLEDLADAAGDTQLTDLIETADYTIPEGWDEAVAYGVKVATDLPRAKVSISPSRVEVEAIADSARDQRQIEKRLRQQAPDSLTLVLNIAAPRPAITPFVLRFVLDSNGPRFDACSAETPEDRSRILTAARDVGAQGLLTCAIGLGAPNDNWADAGVMAIETLVTLGGGSVTFSNADISLLAAPDVDPSLFDTVTAELARRLPVPYTLHASIQEVLRTGDEAADSDLPEFQVIKSPEGHLRISGPLPDSLSQQAVESYLHSRFGMERVSNRIELAEDLPAGWPLRVLTGIEALSALNHGVVTIQPDFIDLTGATGDPEARAQVTQLFGRKLGTGQNYAINVDYLVTLDPEAHLPSPQECVDQINAILTEEKITFAPSSVTVEGSSVQVVNRIAEAMKDCQDVPMEIGGHTDSQGREEMNQQLSQSRADAVLNALLARRILTTNLTARGYGEAAPIDDNGTEEGREANRRIEFKLLLPEETPATAEEQEPETDPEPIAEDDTQVASSPDAESSANGEETVTSPVSDAVPQPRPTTDLSDTETEAQDGQN